MSDYLKIYKKFRNDNIRVLKVLKQMGIRQKSYSQDNKAFYYQFDSDKTLQDVLDNLPVDITAEVQMKMFENCGCESCQHEEEMLPEDADLCAQKTAKSDKTKYKYDGGSCYFAGCKSGYVPNEKDNGCVKIPKKESINMLEYRPLFEASCPLIFYLLHGGRLQIGGDTFDIKDDIKASGNFHWDSFENAWVSNDSVNKAQAKAILTDLMSNIGCQVTPYDVSNALFGEKKRQYTPPPAFKGSGSNVIKVTWYHHYAPMAKFNYPPNLKYWFMRLGGGMPSGNNMMDFVPVDDWKEDIFPMLQAAGYEVIIKEGKNGTPMDADTYFKSGGRW